MSVIRTQKTSHYVAIDNAVVEDSRLSFAARGLLAFLLSKPPEWEVSINHLIKQSPAGKDHIYTLIRELEQYGYMEKRNERREAGKFGGYDWIVQESPNHSGLSATATPHRGGLTVAVEPDPVNPKQVNKQGSKTDISNSTLADNKSYPQTYPQSSNNNGILPNNWQPSDKFYQSLEAKKIPKPTKKQIEKFVNYHHGKGTQIYDPDSLFMFWVEGDYERAKKGLTRNGKPLPNDEKELLAMGKEYGIKPYTGELWPQFKKRLHTLMTAREANHGEN